MESGYTRSSGNHHGRGIYHHGSNNDNKRNNTINGATRSRDGNYDHAIGSRFSSLKGGEEGEETSMVSYVTADMDHVRGDAREEEGREEASSQQEVLVLEDLS